MRHFSIAAAGLMLLMAARPAQAHHSFAAEFDINKSVTLKGTLTKLEWVNPHGWLHIDVKGPDGKVQTWAIEAGSATALLRAGVRKTDLAIGVELTVEGYRATNGTNTAAGRTVKTADGRNFLIAGQQPGAAQ